MSIKDELLKFRTKITETVEEKATSTVDSINTSIDLDDKVDEFMKWYYENMVKGHYTDIGEYHQPIEMRNFIEKMAVWYELRFPEYEINRLMPCYRQEEMNINDVMFRNNPYVNDLLDENSDVKELDWDEFYNTRVFVKSLPIDERCLLTRPWYMSIEYLVPTEKAPFNLYLTRNGFVKKSENVSNWTNSIVTDEELVGLHVRKVAKLLKDRGIELPKNSDLEETIRNVDKQIYCKEEMLNCVMYRIIQRAGDRIGPRRAFLFAKEFGRNIDIPMMYAVDRTDPGLRLFMNEYLKAGGSKDLKCYIGYFFRTNKKEKLDTISIQDLILKQPNNAITFYTPEEHELHQRLVNAISSQLDHDSLKQEKVKQLRLARKLEKRRRNKDELLDTSL